MRKEGASHRNARPALSTSRKASATRAPPILSAIDPRKVRARISATANAVNAGHTAQPRATKRRDAKVVMAPNPALVNARPSPGSQTARKTFRKEADAPAVGATRGNGATKAREASGTSAVASAMAAKP